MIGRESLEHRETLDYSFLLLAHVICADQQLHDQELRFLEDLVERSHVRELTLAEMKKILERDDTQIPLEKSAQNVPIGERSEVLKKILMVAQVDGYFSGLEREIVNQIAQVWGIDKYQIEHMIKDAPRINNRAVSHNKTELSVRARFLKTAESMLSRRLINKIGQLTPGLEEKIEQVRREILLSGPEYDGAIQRCAKVAREDFRYADQSLRMVFSSLQELRHGLQHVIDTIKGKTVGKGEHQTAQEVANQLEQTQQKLSAEILRDLESVREALRAKERSLNHFSIAFMGRTKAGKSTLHAVITRGGWESIGIGKQRTTRYNRVYEWKNIRVIDTPGIGAPGGGGKTDEEVASSIVEESDVICYVVTDDSIQESEFAFLKLLKEKTKPLIILLNIQYNLREPQRLEYFLKNPERWFAKEGKSGIGGHLNRIKRYAQQHYPNDYLTVIPVMLLAAQLAQEPEFERYSKQLFAASRIQNFLDSIRTSLISHGAIRRSQTLLGSTGASINTPHQWITQQAKTYDTLGAQLRETRQGLDQRLKRAEGDYRRELEQKTREMFQTLFEQVNPFAEEHWKAKESEMKKDWKEVLRGLEFENQLRAAAENAAQRFQDEVREVIGEIADEFKIISQLQVSSFQFSGQSRSFIDFFDRDSVRTVGLLVAALGTTLVSIFPPLGLLSVAGGIVSFLAGLFQSRDKQRRKAVAKISSSLRKQLKKQQTRTLEQSQESFQNYCQSIAAAVDSYLEELIQGVEAIASQLKTAQEKLAHAANYLNCAYAKRIVDWATDQPGPLNDISISEKVHAVNRDFGRTLQIQTTLALPLTKSPEEICTILQEHVSIQHHLTLT